MSVTDKAYAPHPSTRVAFIGLGTMGAPMAAHLLRAGHHVTVYNRTAAKAQAWLTEQAGAVVQAQAQTAVTPAEAARGATVVFTCVGNDDDLREVVSGPQGVFQTLQPGGTVVDHTTASADVARELAAAARERGLQFVDAPVSGGNVGAINGALTVMCGGDAQAFAQVQPLDRAPAGVGQRLDDGRSPHADRVEQGDQRGGGVEVGAGGGEVFADRLGRRAGDDQVVRMAVDHLATFVDLGGHGLHDGRGGEAVVGFVVADAAFLRALRRAQVTEQ